MSSEVGHNIMKKNAKNANGYFSIIQDLWGKIFPQDVARLYEELNELLYEYQKNAHSLLSSGSQVTIIGDQVNRAKDTIAARKNSVDEAIAALTLLNSKNTALSSEDLSTVGRLFISITQAAKEESNISISQHMEWYDQNNETARSAHQSVVNIVGEIRNKLEEIERLSLDGMNRLDGIAFYDSKHQKMLAKIPCNDVNYREKIVALMKSYITLLVMLYKVIAQHAHKILNDFSNRKIIDYTQYDDLNAKVASSALLSLDWRFAKVMREFSEGFGYNESWVLNEFSTGIDFYTNFFNSEPLTPEDVENAKIALRLSSEDAKLLEDCYKARNKSIMQRK